MNFFQAQEKARRTSRWLVGWFLLTILAIIAIFYVLASMAVNSQRARGGGASGLQNEYSAGKVVRGAAPSAPSPAWNPGLLGIVTLVVGGTILTGSAVKLSVLSAGGSIVASELGGRKVDPSTATPLERRLLNVVEEMSIASGTPMPEVWVLDREAGINAFAAGTDPANAVVAVTRGCLRRLSRDELQGVIGHEFSHILNGDMKLNIRLIGLVFGLVALATLGRIILESLRYFRSSRSKDSGQIVLIVVLAGVAAWLIGSIGVFFGRLLQAAVSRQREHLADASAVQFTRYPEGLARALRKIGGLGHGGGKIDAPRATASRHLFFAESSGLNLGLATHPPLDQRIRALDSHWDGSMLPSEELDPFSAEIEEEERTRRGRFPGLRGGLLLAAVLGDGEWGGGEEEARISPAEAKAVLLGLLLATDPAQREQGLRLIAENFTQEMASHAEVWHARLAGKPRAEINAVIDYVLPWLRQLAAPEEARKFVDLTERLIFLDGQVDIFEFMISKIIYRQVTVGLALRPVPAIRYTSLRELKNETAVLVGALARYNKSPGVFAAAGERFYAMVQEELLALDLDACTLEAVSAALEKFESAAPPVKGQILELCEGVAAYDGEVVEEEEQFLCAFSAAIGVPRPQNFTVLSLRAGS